MGRERAMTLAVLALAAASLVPAASGLPAVPKCYNEALTLPAGRLEGTAGDDVMLGTAGNDVMKGLGGDDTICGGGGDDTIFGGTGRDSIRGDAGHDRLYGGAGWDELRGDDGDDRLYGEGCDWLQGNVGNDVLLPGAQAGVDCAGIAAEGGPGKDRFVTDGIGDLELRGGLGVDTVDLRDAAAAMDINLGTGELRLLGAPTVDSCVHDMETVFGSAGGDSISGNASRNHLLGFGGDDFLYGKEGDDYLAGGAGSDYVDGGDGYDACWQWETTGINCEN